MQNKIPESNYYPDGVFKDSYYVLVHLEHSNMHENFLYLFLLMIKGIENERSNFVVGDYRKILLVIRIYILPSCYFLHSYTPPNPLKFNLL